MDFCNNEFVDAHPNGKDDKLLIPKGSATLTSREAKWHEARAVKVNAGVYPD